MKERNRQVNKGEIVGQEGTVSDRKLCLNRGDYHVLGPFVARLCEFVPAASLVAHRRAQEK